MLLLKISGIHTNDNITSTNWQEIFGNVFIRDIIIIDCMYYFVQKRFYNTNRETIPL